MYIETILNKLKEEELIYDYRIRFSSFDYCDVEITVIFNRKTYGLVLRDIGYKEISYKMLKNTTIQGVHQLLDNF